MSEQIKHILIVEDDEAHAELVRRAFETYPDRFRLTVVGNLAEARHSLASFVDGDRPDLVVADLLLPDGKGTELLPDGESPPPFPLMVMTSYGNEQVAVEAMKAGALDYIVKSATTLTEMPRAAERALREWEHLLGRRQAEQALRESEERFRNAFDNAPIGLSLVAPDGSWLKVNQALSDIVGYSEEELLSMTYEMITHPDDLEENLAYTRQLLAGKISKFQLEKRYYHKQGPLVWVSISTSLVRDVQDKPLYFISQVQDITERKQLEEQLRQSQKMEAIGRLAGGVAHDFNNILTAILGSSDFILMTLDEDDPRRRDVEQIRRSAQRAASLTRQLLAFSRQQVLQPEILNLNNVVSDMEKMLRRLIGENIDFMTFLEPNLDSVKVDPGQVEQVIMNLVINARDAMPCGGKLSLETANFYLDETYAHQHPGVKAGPYVMLAVSDTGQGMEADIKDRIFDPFFTTKEQGKGTGLGLATVHGIVNQSGGHIWVYSEPEQGTTFKIYLPQAERTVAGTTFFEQPPAKIDPAWETILLVEDNDSVRELARRALLHEQYTVLEADTGEQAVAISAAYEGSIHLLVTDVVIPGNLSGAQLAAQLRIKRPQIRVLYMSGYTDNSIVHHGVLDPGIPFLQKPFTPEGLAQKVRNVLDMEKGVKEIT